MNERLYQQSHSIHEINTTTYLKRVVLLKNLTTEKVRAALSTILGYNVRNYLLAPSSFAFKVNIPSTFDL